MKMEMHLVPDLPVQHRSSVTMQVGGSGGSPLPKPLADLPLPHDTPTPGGDPRPHRDFMVHWACPASPEMEEKQRDPPFYEFKYKPCFLRPSMVAEAKRSHLKAEMLCAIKI